MPWVLEDLFAAGGMDVWSELPCAGSTRSTASAGRASERAPGLLLATSSACATGSRSFSARDAGALDSYLAGARADLPRGDPRRGPARRSGAGDLARFLPTMLRTGAAPPLHLTARHFRDERVRQAFSFHSLFIGGDPFRVPAVYAALVHLQVADGGWYCDGGVYSMVEALARPLDVRCGARVERDRAARRARAGVGSRDG